MSNAASYEYRPTSGNHSVSAGQDVDFRPATPGDIPALVELENAAFDSDRLTRRNFQWMLTRANATLLIGERGGTIVAYVLVLYHRGTSLARVYSMAVAASERGRGLGRRLLILAEDDARARDCAYMRLEVRPDNPGAIALYESLGYRLFETKDDYYEDHQPARRYEKRILRMATVDVNAVPYYAQTTEFTCGPAALMMALAHNRPDTHLSPTLELQIWREATTIYMTSGHGGCGPHGLALAAHRRGLRAAVYLNQSTPLFVEGVRSDKKKRVIELVQADFEAQIAETDIVLHDNGFTMHDLAGALQAGAVPIILISSYRLTRSKAPHWVAVTGIDRHYVYVHDPEVDEQHDKTPLDCAHVPIPRKDFERMTRFGSRRLQAMVVLSR